LDAGAAKQRKEYYMGEGGGFPRVRAMVSQVSPGRGESNESVLPVACPNIKNVSEGELTNSWLVLM